MLARLKVGNPPPPRSKLHTNPLLLLARQGIPPLLMGDLQPNLKYRIFTKREVYGYLAVQAKCPEMVWVR